MHTIARPFIPASSTPHETRRRILARRECVIKSVPYCRDVALCNANGWEVVAIVAARPEGCFLNTPNISASKVVEFDHFGSGVAKSSRYFAIRQKTIGGNESVPFASRLPRRNVSSVHSPCTAT